jgi:hypothetical protein
LPLLLKIVWILTLLRTVSSVFMVFSVYGLGWEFFGTKVFGLLAVNLAFFTSLVLPVVLLIAMINRYRWAWLPGIIYYLFLAVNEVFGFAFLDETHGIIMTKITTIFQMLHLEQDENSSLIYISLAASLILVTLVFLAIGLVFILKRKYFTTVQPDAGPQMDQKF